MTRIVSKHWRPCPEGEFDRLDTRLRFARIWQKLSTLAVIAFTIASVGAASWVVAGALKPTYSPSPRGGCAPPIVVPAKDCN